jgi:hypothetical protein
MTSIYKLMNLIFLAHKGSIIDEIDYLYFFFLLLDLCFLNIFFVIKFFKYFSFLISLKTFLKLWTWHVLT